MNNTVKPLVSTIIPTYRRPNLLRRAIKSVLNQKYPYFQICVYDNASGDETAQIVAELAQKDNRIKYYCHQENIGPFLNFKYGMEHVETPFFSFLSDDDILLPEFYQTAMEGFEKYPKAFFSSALTLISDDQCNIWGSYGFGWTPGFYQPPKGLLAILKNGAPTCTGIIFRKALVERIGIFDSEVDAAADLDFELRAAARFPFVISNKPGAVFIFHPLSISSCGTFSGIWPGWLKMIRKLTGDDQIPEGIRAYAASILTKRIKKILFYLGCISIQRKNFEDTCKISEVLCTYYHLKAKAYFLSIAAKVCDSFPVIYKLGVFSGIIRKFILMKKQLYLQKNRISPSILAYVKRMQNA